MTKDDWIKLAMPASITLLAAAIVAIPMLTNAQILQAGTKFDPIYIHCMNGSCQ